MATASNARQGHANHDLMLSPDIGGSECLVLHTLPAERSTLLPANSSPSLAEAAASAISREDRVGLGLGEYGGHEPDRTLRLPSRRPSPQQVPVTGEATSSVDMGELCALMHNASATQILNELRRAACRGLSPDAYHPDQGQPTGLALARCHGCQARPACLTFALRTEDPEERYGWYGGLGPSARDVLAASLGTSAPGPLVVTESDRAATLRSQGWTVNAIADELHCSRRTVQRYLKKSAA